MNQDEDNPYAPQPLEDDKGKSREQAPGERFIDEGSDLVKGVYEGGLKTWECSLDLVDCLDQRGYTFDTDLETERVRGKSILEVSCCLS